MKVLRGIFLLALSSILLFYKVGVMVYWVANHDLIAAKHCKNISKPQLNCKGTCFLNDKFKAEHPGDANMPTKGGGQLIIQMDGFAPPLSFDFNIVTSTSKSINAKHSEPTPYRRFYVNPEGKSIVQPPECEVKPS